MTLLQTPKFVALDSATLSKVAKDFWSDTGSARSRSRTFIDDLKDSCVYITLTMGHLCELLSHDDPGVALDRLAWLRTLPMIAWVRPYGGNWFVGGFFDLLLYELHAVVYGSQREWKAIIDGVRPALIETGVGSEMFPDDPQWAAIRAHARRSSVKRQYIASIARIDVGDIFDVKLKEFGPLAELPNRDTHSEQLEAERFARGLEVKLRKHGDRRIVPDIAAVDFTRRVVSDLAQVRTIGGDPYKTILDVYEVPRQLATPDMTVGELGELAIYVAHLRLLGKELRPPFHVSVADIPIDILPSHVLERSLRREQHLAPRVSGSDLGDGQIVALAFYIDAIEVDKRTHNHLNTIRRKQSNLGQHLGCFFRSRDDYHKILDELSQAGII